MDSDHETKITKGTWPAPPPFEPGPGGNPPLQKIAQQQLSDSFFRLQYLIFAKYQLESLPSEGRVKPDLLRSTCDAVHESQIR